MSLEPAVRPESRYSAFLRDYTTTGPGTPGGNMLRRYWHPVCLSQDLCDVPFPVRMLGEDLVAYRAGNGSVGLVDKRCPHRGASLLYGQVTDEGIQCSYHGWTFDGRGICLAMPLEAPASKLKNMIRHRAYRVEEWGGIVWCYMGPDQDSPPPLPRIDLLARRDGTPVVQRGVFFPDKDGAIVKIAESDIRNYNYLSFLENIVDMAHVYALHMIAAPALPEDLAPYCDLSVDTNWHNTVHKVFETDYGMKAVVVHNTAREHIKFVNTFSVAMPTTYRFSGLGARQSDFCDDRRESGGLLRIIDDEHFEIIRFMLMRDGNYRNQNAMPPRTEGDGGAPKMRGRFDKKPYDMREYAAWEGNIVLEDLVMQESQGAIPDRTIEHLTPCDVGVGMMRRIWQRSFEAVAAGEAPKQPRAGPDGTVEIDTFKGFVRADELALGPANLPSSRNGGGLIRDAAGELVF